MKLISYSNISYVISLALHFLVFAIIIYISNQPRAPIRSFQTSIHFESDLSRKRSNSRPQKPIISKATRKSSPSKKLSLVPKIKRKNIVVPKMDPTQTPSLKKYITPPKSAPVQNVETSGYLRSNKRTKKPTLPIAPAEVPTTEKQQPGISSPVQSGIEKSSSAPQREIRKNPDIPPPSSIENDSKQAATVKGLAPSVWQKKTDLLVYRKSLAKLVTANWVVPLTSVKDFQILIEVHIGPRGNIIDIRPIKRSGLAILDAAAERAIRVSTPFPEFPKSFKENRKLYRAVFRFTPDKVAN